VTKKIFHNGDEYSGDFKGRLMNGEGIYKFANGDTHKGKFKDDKFHGMGTQLVNGD
jgi:hypothetical protein